MALYDFRRIKAKTINVITKILVKGKEIYMKGKKPNEKYERGTVETDQKGYAKVYFDEAYSEAPNITAVYIGKRTSTPIRRKIPTTTDITFFGEPNLTISWHAIGVREED